MRMQKIIKIKLKSWFESSTDWWEYHTKRGEYIVKKDCYGWQAAFVPNDSVMRCQLGIIVQLEDAKALCVANNKREERS